MKGVFTYRLAAVALLAASGAYRYLNAVTPIGLDPYFERIRVTSEAVPRQIGAWVGTDVPVPVQATTVLRPNVMLSRRYTNVENGSSVGILLVHCEDAHHMVGHFPLRCYPAQGWAVRENRAREWSIDGLGIKATEYHFFKEGLDGAGGERSTVVINSLLRPGGTVLRDMDGLTRSLVGRYGPAYGAGQLQIYFEGRMPQEQRDGAVVDLVKGYGAALRSILADPQHVQ